MQHPPNVEPAQAPDRLTARMRAHHAELRAQEQAKTPAERRAEARDARRAVRDARRRIMQSTAEIARRDGFTADAARLAAQATRLARATPTVTVPRTVRQRGAGRPARRSAASSTTSSADPGDGEPEPPPPRYVPEYVQRFARASCVGIDKVRWCRARHCRAVAYVVDDLQRAKADAAGFGDLCPSCSGGRAAR